MGGRQRRARRRRERLAAYQLGYDDAMEGLTATPDRCDGLATTDSQKVGYQEGYAKGERVRMSILADARDSALSLIVDGPRRPRSHGRGR